MTNPDQSKSPKKSAARGKAATSRQKQAAIGAPLRAKKDRAAMIAKRCVFLEAVRGGTSIGGACRLAGIDRSTISAWLKSDPTFRTDYDDAYQTGTDQIEDMALDRATAAEKPSDLLLIFTLRGRRPERWRDNHKIEVTHTTDPDARVFMATFTDFQKRVMDAHAAHQERLAREATHQGNGPPMLLTAETIDPKA